MKIKFITQNVCAGCGALETFLKNEHADIDIETINIDKDTDAVEKYGIMATPTTILWDVEFDEEVTRHIGFIAGEDEDFIDELIYFAE